MIPDFVKIMENKYYAVKLEVKRRNVDEKSFTYVATAIFQIFGHDNNTEMNDNTVTEHMEESMTRVSIIK